MRRGYLYNFAQQMGCNKIALGHHYDDVIETILMGMLYSAQVQTMIDVYKRQIIYWVITFVLERVISYLEKKLRVPEDAPALLDIRDTEVE